MANTLWGFFIFTILLFSIKCGGGSSSKSDSLDRPARRGQRIGPIERSYFDGNHDVAFLGSARIATYISGASGSLKAYKYAFKEPNYTAGDTSTVVREVSGMVQTRAAIDPKGRWIAILGSCSEVGGSCQNIGDIKLWVEKITDSTALGVEVDITKCLTGLDANEGDRLVAVDYPSFSQHDTEPLFAYGVTYLDKSASNTTSTKKRAICIAKLAETTDSITITQKQLSSGSYEMESMPRWLPVASSNTLITKAQAITTGTDNSFVFLRRDITFASPPATPSELTLDDESKDMLKSSKDLAFTASEGHIFAVVNHLDKSGERLISLSLSQNAATGQKIEHETIKVRSVSALSDPKLLLTAGQKSFTCGQASLFSSYFHIFNYDTTKEVGEFILYKDTAGVDKVATSTDICTATESSYQDGQKITIVTASLVPSSEGTDIYNIVFQGWNNKDNEIFFLKVDLSDTTTPKLLSLYSISNNAKP